jgi:hypothetical protein
MNGLKFTNAEKTELVGLLAPFGGPINGSDIQGERFTAKTDFVLDWFPGDRPLLYHHGLERPSVSVVGRIKSVTTDDQGLWIRAQLDARSAYYGAISKLIDSEALGLSSGAMPHLVKVAKNGDIMRWPLIEGSLTPTPANPMATLDFETVKSHYKAIDIDVVEDGDTIKAVMAAEQRNALSDADFAYIDSQGGRHLPMNDAAHARAALARFNQTAFESPEAKAAAMRKLIARCKELGIDVAPAKAAEFITSALEEDDIYGDALTVVTLENHASFVKSTAESLLVRTKDLQERRVKAGRVISTLNRAKLTECLAAMRTATDDLAQLLDSTNPAPAVEAKAHDVRRLRASLEASYLRSLLN